VIKFPILVCTVKTKVVAFFENHKCQWPALKIAEDSWRVSVSINCRHLVCR